MSPFLKLAPATERPSSKAAGPVTAGSVQVLKKKERGARWLLFSVDVQVWLLGHATGACNNHRYAYILCVFLIHIHIYLCVVRTLLRC